MFSEALSVCRTGVALLTIIVIENQRNKKLVILCDSRCMAVLLRCPLLLNACAWRRDNLRRASSSALSAGGNLMNPSSNTDGEDFNAKKVTSLQSILKASNSWEQCWVEDVTPWDLGKVTPVVADLVERNNLPVGRALVPGCGSGYDVVALASRARHVIGLDISATAVEHAQKIWAGTKSINVEFVCWDFFNYMPGAPFDLILDYTFFCALQPSMRPLWGSKIADLLSSEGELITIMFPMDSFEGGPPYAVSLAAYENALHPQGLRCTFFQENALAVGKRKGREFLGRWRRVATKL